MRKTEAEKHEAIERLRQWIKPGDTLYTILRHVSRTGMFRRVSVKKIECIDGRTSVLHLDYNVARAIGASTSKIDDGVPVGGCGMDMGFHIVYSLGWALFGKGLAYIGPNCPSNDHSNGMKRPAAPAPEITHTDGGYALRQEWM
jgi:hypothetical protein